MASGKGNTNAAGILQAIYQATFTDLSTVLANAASPITNIYVSLHTADPFTTAGSGTIGTQNASEATYGGGTTGGWTLTNETITNASAITFGACVGGSGETETYVGIGTASTGTGILLWYGQLTSSLAVSNGITPSIASGSLSITES